MAIKVFKPTINSRRNMSVTDFSVLSKVAPEKSLLAPLNKKSGRNSYGRITVRHRGGGNRRKYRIIDFKRQKFDVEGTVKTLEYDPNRSAFIALIEYTDGDKAYIIAPEGLKVGDKVTAGENADIKPGNALPLTAIPVGTFIHNVELYPGRGAQLARSAGNMAQLMAKENGLALLRLPSGELRNVPESCMATIGQVGNVDHENVKIGKAGRKRNMGWRPTVRGSVMTLTITRTAVVKVNLLLVVRDLLLLGVSLHSVTRLVRTTRAATSLSFAEETVSKAEKGA